MSISSNLKTKKNKLDPTILRVAIILATGALAPMLNSTMINVAFKIIAVDMNASISVAQWIITGYVLSMGLVIPVTGWVVNRFGCKRIYLFSLFLFFIGSAFAMISWSIESLICAAIIQGISTGLIISTIQTEIVHISDGQNLGRLLSIATIPALLGPILGPTLGGVIVSGFNWRAIYLIDILVCFIMIPLSWKLVPKDKACVAKPSLDLFGLIILSPAFALVVYGIVQISSQGNIYSPEVDVPLGIGIFLLVIFTAYALKTKREPILDIGLLKSGGFSSAIIALFFTGLISNGGMLLLPLFYQEVTGFSILEAGIWLIPQGIGMFLAIRWVGKMTERDSSNYILLACFGSTALGTLPFAFSNPETNIILLSVALLIRGGGLGGIFIYLMNSAYVGLRREQVPHATTIIKISQTVGGAFGSAVIATLLQSKISDNHTHSINTVCEAYNNIFWWVIAFTVLASIPALFLNISVKKASVLSKKKTVTQENDGISR